MKSRVFRDSSVPHRQDLEGAPLASFKRRAAAFLLDFLLIIPILAAFQIGDTLLHQKYTGNFTLDIDPFHGWSLLSLPAYFGLSTWLGRGKTLGKKLFGIRVVSLTHHKLGLWHSIERSLGYAASALEGGFGFFQYFIHPNSQTVHDRIAETIVVRDHKQHATAASLSEEPVDPSAADPAGTC